jgi:RNA polymerase sigma-70 factor, ECF subfamily
MAEKLKTHKKDAGAASPARQTPSETDLPFDASGRVPPPDFARVYVEHFDFACRSLSLLGVAPDGLEDAAQDVFGVVSRRLVDFDARASLRTWLFAIVQRVAANHRRSHRRKNQPLQPLSPATRADDASPEECAQAAQAASLVRRFCNELDGPRRAVFVLALVEEVPAREIAPLLGVPLFTVYSRIRSLREQLQRFLERHEAER